MKKFGIILYIVLGSICGAICFLSGIDLFLYINGSLGMSTSMIPSFAYIVCGLFLVCCSLRHLKDLFR